VREKVKKKEEEKAKDGPLFIFLGVSFHSVSLLSISSTLPRLQLSLPSPHIVTGPTAPSCRSPSMKLAKLISFTAVY